MQSRRFRCLPGVEMLAVRMVPSTVADPTAVSAPDTTADTTSYGLVDPGTTDAGTVGTPSDTSATDAALNTYYGSDSSGTTTAAVSCTDPTYDPLAPGGPLYVDLTMAVTVAPTDAYA